ncbi:hydrolase 1, exosortase A system-associated [Massilia suwonensis]|uniref:Hydrolase 1, exosortase A system-associated n=1 Tax=Massilia suwonensis TaxID=648895 RepID=A0ABW0MKQ1_9BURK
MKIEQRALRFHCAGNALIGIVDVPERPLVRGMLILTDSSQYRAGSHRQFTLLSRLLAARGVAVMRFDRAGAGDSEGMRAPQGVEDIGAAMKEFFIHVPEMKESVILAPGDAAGAAALYAAGDARVTGLALLDPLLPVVATGAPAPALRYGPRSAADRLFRRAAAFRRAASRVVGRPVSRESQTPSVPPALAQALGGFGGRVLLVCGGPKSGNLDAARALEGQHPRSRRVEIAHAGPDTRRSAWRDAVAFACAGWLGSW